MTHKFERALMQLRKSRADLEAEKRGEGETLKRHKKILLKFAKENNINIVKIRPELESGESLIHRPEMLKTLDEVEQGLYDGVLCMDIDRLGRGDMQDQGLILSTFRKANTKIITPRKVYDLNDEFDEEYTEFEAFFARREFKYINRRLQRGRIASVEEGNYLGTVPPYGFNILKLKDGRTLKHHPVQGPAVTLMYDLYAHEDPSQRIGSNKIATKLNSLGYRTYTGKKWTHVDVLNVLKNPHNAGLVIWKRVKREKSTDPGKKTVSKQRPRKEWILIQGKHKGLTTMEKFMRSEEIRKSGGHVPHGEKNEITNPLAGLIRCDMCGSSMVLRPYTRQKPHIRCYNQLCENKSTRFEYVEQRLIAALADWLDGYKLQWGKHKPKRQKNNTLDIKKQALKNLERELKELDNQKSKLHDFLERGIYDEETYLERSRNLAERMENTHTTIDATKKDIEVEKQRGKAQKDIIPTVERVLDVYHETDDPAEKNNLLKTVLDKAVYRKEKTQTGDDFTLVLTPKIPRQHKQEWDNTDKQLM